MPLSDGPARSHADVVPTDIVLPPEAARESMAGST